MIPIGKANRTILLENIITNALLPELQKQTKFLEKILIELTNSPEESIKILCESKDLPKINEKKEEPKGIPTGSDWAIGKPQASKGILTASDIHFLSQPQSIPIESNAAFAQAVKDAEHYRVEAIQYKLEAAKANDKYNGLMKLIEEFMIANSKSGVLNKVTAMMNGDMAKGMECAVVNLKLQLSSFQAQQDIKSKEE